MLYTLFVGLEKDKDGLTLNIPIKEATIEAETDTALTFGGYSANPVYGGWVNPDHLLMREKALRIEVVGTDIPRDKVIEWAMRQRDRFNQGSVLLVESKALGTFV